MSEHKSSHMIGMFDSGLGGLTVFDAIQKKLPHEKIVYLGDTARLPYGEKSAETVLRYSIENAIFLMEHSLKVLVIACNTASAVSVEKLQKIFNIPVIGVIEPGAEKAVSLTKTGRIGVLATKGTINSGAYTKQILKLLPSAEVVSIACPLLASLVEEGMTQHAATELILNDYLKPLQSNPVDTLLLGCTHYPLLKPLIQKAVGSHVTIIDSALSCALKLEEILKEKNLLHPSQEKVSHQFFVSDNPEKFRQLGQQFISWPLPKVHLQQCGNSS